MKVWEMWQNMKHEKSKTKASFPSTRHKQDWRCRVPPYLSHFRFWITSRRTTNSLPRGGRHPAHAENHHPTLKYYNHCYDHSRVPFGSNRGVEYHLDCLHHISRVRFHILVNTGAWSSFDRQTDSQSKRGLSRWGIPHLTRLFFCSFELVLEILCIITALYTTSHEPETFIIFDSHPHGDFTSCFRGITLHSSVEEPGQAPQ